jgi:hypothetical protein
VRLQPGLTTLVIRAIARVVCITIGVFFTDFMFSVAIPMGYLLIATWLIPTAIRRFP